MELSDLVCDFEYAEKLKELGVNTEHLFWHGHEGELPTYTATELMGMLPNSIEIEEQELFLKINKKECGYSVDYNFEEKCFDEDFYAKFANALADCLIWHIENGYIKAEDL